MSARKVALLALVTVVLSVVASAPVQAAPSHGSPQDAAIVITPVSPLPGSTVYTEEPNITASFTDTSGTVQPQDVIMVVDGLNATATGDATITVHAIYYDVPTILKLSPGNSTVTVTITVPPDAPVSYSWGFNVSTSAPPAAPIAAFNGKALLIEVGIGTVIFVGAFSGYILYLKRTRRFTFRKYFATHPIQKEYLTLYLPSGVAFFAVLGGLSFVLSTPNLPWFSTDLVFIVGLFIALAAYGVDARREKAIIHEYESAFAQFLFELADALRGGIDPAKAIIEISKTETDIMAKPLRIAAAGLQIGQPFDGVLRTMVSTMKSPLISRYAALIADASGVGGETSAVVYRAARDLDDFIKIEKERAQQLTLPVGVIYISFGVLIAVLFALLNIAPSLGTINIGIISHGFGASSSAPLPAAVPSISPLTMRERFLELSLIAAVGNGALIGAFSDGKPKYGIPHALGMAAVIMLIFIIIYP